MDAVADLTIAGATVAEAVLVSNAVLVAPGMIAVTKGMGINRVVPSSSPKC